MAVGSSLVIVSPGFTCSWRFCKGAPSAHLQVWPWPQRDAFQRERVGVGVGAGGVAPAHHRGAPPAQVL